MFIQHRSSRYENRRTFVTPQWNFGRVSHGTFIHGSPPVPWSPESVPHLGQPAMDDNRRAQSLFAFATELHSRCKVLVKPIKRGRHQSGAVTTSACRKCAHRPRCQQRQRRATSTRFFWILCTIMKDIWPQRAGFIPQAAPKQ